MAIGDPPWPPVGHLPLWGGADLSTFTPRPFGNQMTDYDDLERGHVREALGRIEAKVDTVIDKLAGHDGRLAAVEKRQWYTAGGISLAIALLVPKIKTLLGL